MEHVKGRHAFGRPLAQFEGVSFPIAEAHTRLEMARWLCYRALWLRDQGLPHTKEAAMCKWIGPAWAAQIIHECLLLNGHYGYEGDAHRTALAGRHRIGDRRRDRANPKNHHCP